MKAAGIAYELRSLGVAVLSYAEGRGACDGEIAITEHITVHVPTFGDRVNVSVAVHGRSPRRHWPLREPGDWDGIRTDISQAATFRSLMSLGAQAGSQSDQNAATSVSEPAAACRPLSGCNQGNRCPWSEESQANSWRAVCRQCGQRAQGSGQ